MKRRQAFKSVGLALAGLIIGPILMAATPPPVVVTGAGSTFVNPVLSAWTAAYMADFHASGGVKIVYQSVGSGAGIELIKAGKVDFGASDMPLKPDELAKSGLGQFPLVIGGVVPVVNISGVAPGRMRFTGPLLADIYLGKIKRWNDPAIARLNPGVTLPDAEIRVVHRSDGSGTTFNWVNYLSKESPEWRTKVGEGITVAWPLGQGANGNDGVASLVQQTPNAIGYVEYAYVTLNHLTWSLVQNRAGQFVAPNAKSFQAAADTASWNAAPDFYLVLTDAPGADSYPITATSFILVRKRLPNHLHTRELLNLFEWALGKGQPQAASLGYVPLPRPLALRVEAYWTTNIKH
jgi:phosphate transport system substrate-binding protein